MLQRARKDNLPSKVKRCFEKCAFCQGDNDLTEVDQVDLKFSTLVKEICPDIFLDKYVEFDVEKCIYSGDMVKQELRVTSYELRFTSYELKT